MNFTRILIIIGFLSLGVTIWFLPKNKNTELAPDTEAKNDLKNLVIAFEDSSKKMLDKEMLSTLNKLQAEIDGTSKNQSSKLLDSVANIWNSRKNMTLTAWYRLKAAEASNIPADLFRAGQFAYMVSRFEKSAIKAVLINQAIAMLEIGLKQQDDVDSRIVLASCYVEGTAEPMKGISILREIVAKDSANVQANLQLSLFAMQSGQFDKAIDRLKKLKKIDEDNMEIDLYLAQAYAESGDKANALITLQEYRKKSKDPVVNAQVDDYIKQLKNN